MSKLITSQTEIPNAAVYVLANDSFMSGWGEAKGRTNTIILPCDSTAEARAVCDYARGRSDMKRIRVLRRKPKVRPGHTYSLMSPEEAPAWYGGKVWQSCAPCAGTGWTQDGRGNECPTCYGRGKVAVSR